MIVWCIDDSEHIFMQNKIFNDRTNPLENVDNMKLGIQRPYLEGLIIIFIILYLYYYVFGYVAALQRLFGGPVPVCFGPSHYLESLIKNIYISC